MNKFEAAWQDLAAGDGAEGREERKLGGFSLTGKRCWVREEKQWSLPSHRKGGGQGVGRRHGIFNSEYNAGRAGAKGDLGSGVRLSGSKFQLHHLTPLEPVAT